MEILRQLSVTLKYVALKSKIMTISLFWQVNIFIIIGDGIYDKLSNDEIITVVWDTLIRDEGKFKNIHEFCGKAV